MIMHKVTPDVVRESLQWRELLINMFNTHIYVGFGLDWICHLIRRCYGPKL